jgi:hypothetical protein
MLQRAFDYPGGMKSVLASISCHAEFREAEDLRSGFSGTAYRLAHMSKISAPIERSLVECCCRDNESFHNQREVPKTIKDTGIIDIKT